MNTENADVRNLPHYTSCCRVSNAFYANVVLRSLHQKKILAELGGKVLAYLETHGPHIVSLSWSSPLSIRGDVFMQCTAKLSQPQLEEEQAG